MEIKVVQNVLAANDAIASENRELLARKHVVALNVMGSPGTGKTSLLEQTVQILQGRCKIGVIEGDMATNYDAERIAKLEVPVVQVATGGECHLDAPMVKEALANLDLDALDVVIVENVGNLVCPAEYDLGETKKVVVSSLAEGDDKVEKYPLMFRIADVVVLNKMDLADMVDFDVERFEARLKDINPQAAFFCLSCRAGHGAANWVEWVRTQSR